MNAVIAGLLFVTSTLGGSPGLQPVERQITPATTLTLREAAARPDIPDAAQLGVRGQPQGRASRFSRIERAIAIGAGTVIGFYAGAAVGWRATADPSNRDDDTSGLRGVMIGAPLGAVAGAVIATVLTR